MVICCGSASIWNEPKTFWVNSAVAARISLISERLSDIYFEQAVRIKISMPISVTAESASAYLTFPLIRLCV